MKKLLVVLSLSLLAACAGPTKILVKNCKDLGSNVFSCEEIPEKDLGKSK